MFAQSKIIFGRQLPEDPIPRHIEVGIGDDPGLNKSCLSLNHKQRNAHLKSATEFVAQATDEDIAAWKRAIPFAADGQPFAGISIAVEDASPDTCLALICLYERLLGRTIPRSWVDFASAWEQGYAPQGGEISKMAGALVNALTHSKFGTENAREIDPATFAPILQMAADYLKGLATNEVDPWAVPRLLPAAVGAQVQEAHDFAHFALERERLHYNLVLSGALKVQLSVPIQGANRRAEVDAALLTEVEYTGSLKLFLRNDTSSPLSTGYQVMGLHRPVLAGTGNDMTVSVNPSVGIDLRHLWIEIEKAEERAWSDFATERGEGFSRPREPARNGMRSFLEQPPICVPSQQPWWEGSPIYTLIGAPRKVVIKGEYLPGTRLKWTDILAILWRLYAPINQVPLQQLEYPNEKPWHILEGAPQSCRRVLVNSRTDLHGVRLKYATSSAGLPSIWSPGVAAGFAAFVDVGKVEIDHLPESSAFDVIEDRGGICLVTSRGMLLFEVTTTSGFPADELDRAAKDVASTVDYAMVIMAEINQSIRPLVLEAVSKGSSVAKREALKAIFAAKLTAREAWAQSARFEEDILVRRFRERCEHRWNGGARLIAALDEIKELEEMVVSSSEVRANSTLNAIAFFGFPLSIFGNLLGGLLITNALTKSVDGVLWSVFWYYLGFSAVLMGLVWVAAKVNDTRWRGPKGN